MEWEVRSATEQCCVGLADECSDEDHGTDDDDMDWRAASVEHQDKQ